MYDVADEAELQYMKDLKHPWTSPGIKKSKSKEKFKFRVPESMQVRLQYLVMDAGLMEATQVDANVKKMESTIVTGMMTEVQVLVVVK